MYKKSLVICLFLLIASNYISAQTHISVPLGHPVYAVLEQAQMRGLCNFLPATKPYTRAQILLVINEILDNNTDRRFGRLSDAEINILEQFKITLDPPRGKLDLTRGVISSEHVWDDIYFSGEFGFSIDFYFAGAYYSSAGGYKYEETDDNTLSMFADANHPAAGDFYSDIIFHPSIYFIGDIGNNLSYGFNLYGFAGKSPRAILGKANNYWDAYNPDDDKKNHRLLTIYSEPLAYFPYTYKKRWDGFLFAPGSLSSDGQNSWPENVSLGYAMFPELSGQFFNGHLSYRFARLDREWSGMSNNGSLVLNQSAQAFLAFETLIQPFKWISISSLTGALEFDSGGVTAGTDASLKKGTAEVFQNMFSIVMLETSVKNYFNMSLGSSVVWPKRFELGYPFPFAENFLYQNSVGDYDNLALFLNLQGQYPGIGRVWFSLCMDEVNIDEAKRLFELDRMMYIFQVGSSFNFPLLPFSSITVSYTKNEPYNYTHTRIETPWHKSSYMEQNYVNFGRALGHYIPPNSDELLIRFETMPLPQSLFRLQYQLIRHGADYGNRAVDGSSLWTELDPKGRSDNEALEKYFLQDGAYQWMHIVKLRGEYSLTGFKIPVKIFAEVGGVYSYFTDIEGEPNSGNPGIYKIVDTPQYPHSLYFIGMIGVQIFPKF